MGQPEYLVIGHVTKDLTDGGYRLGGTVAYSALTARNLGKRTAVITSAGPDLDLSHTFEDVDLACIPSPATTTFRNVYEGAARHQYVSTVGNKIGPDIVPPAWRRTPVVHLGPVADEFEEDMIDTFSASLLGLTPQGWLRQWDSRGRVSPRGWNKAAEFLPRLDALIVSEEDLAGEASSLKEHLDLARLAIVTQGARGATLHHQGREHHFPARSAEVLDPTGAGDVFAAAFLVRLEETEDPHQAVRFANIAASLSVEGEGVASIPTRAQIEDLVGSS